MQYQQLINIFSLKTKSICKLTEIFFAISVKQADTSVYSKKVYKS